MAPQAGSVTGSAGEQWLAQLQAMRSAIADLKLTKQNIDDATPYGQDIVINDSSESGSSDDDDVWDFMSDESDIVSDGDSYSFSDGEADTLANGSTYDLKWLASRCEDVSRRTSGLDSRELQEHVIAVLGSDMADDELQMVLAETLGYDELELVAELLSHRVAIVSSASTPSRSSEPLGRLQTKEERMRALELQDLEHKSAPLAAAVARGGEVYPHVYKTHEAGNTLSAYGRRYALPNGSSRQEHDVRCVSLDLHSALIVVEIRRVLHSSDENRLSPPRAETGRDCRNGRLVQTNIQRLQDSQSHAESCVSCGIPHE